MKFLELAKKRYSCRKFSDKRVEKEQIAQILEAAIAAPTAVNTQPFKIWVMESEEAKKNIRQITDYTFGAETFLVVGYEKKGGWVRAFDKRNFADVDASIVATHMMMEIEDLGLATTWVGYFNEPELKEIYPQMEGYELIAILPVGYPAEDAQPSPKHGVRKKREEVVEVL